MQCSFSHQTLTHRCSNSRGRKGTLHAGQRVFFLKCKNNKQTKPKTSDKVESEAVLTTERFSHKRLAGWDSEAPTVLPKPRRERQKQLKLQASACFTAASWQSFVSGEAWGLNQPWGDAESAAFLPLRQSWCDGRIGASTADSMHGASRWQQRCPATQGHTGTRRHHTHARLCVERQAAMVAS